MDLRSILNDKEAPPVRLPSFRFDNLTTSYAIAPSSNDMRHNCHSGECSLRSCNLRTMIANRQAQREDSLAISPHQSPRPRIQEHEGLPKSLPCYECHKLFTRRSDLVRHERIHSGVRPHACPYHGCGKSFIQRSALTIHERVHTGDKPHECKQCGKPFSDSSSLARHRRTHTGVRPYRCDFPGCGKDFTRKTTLSRHRQQHATKGHVPVSASARRSPSKPPSTSTMSSYGTTDDSYSHDSASLPSPALQKPQNAGSMYITFQINQPESETHPHYSQVRNLEPPPPLYRSRTNPEGIQLLQKPVAASPRLPDAPVCLPGDRQGDYFSQQRSTQQHKSYQGSPLPMIVSPGWEDDAPQYGPIGGTEYGCRPRERRDSGISRRYWSVAMGPAHEKVA